MGMFDYVRYTGVMPGGFTTGGTWVFNNLYQTKDLGYAPDFVLDYGPDLNIYEIDENGCLMLLERDWDYAKNPDGPRHPTRYNGTIDLIASRRNGKKQAGGVLDAHDFFEWRMWFEDGFLKDTKTLPLDLTPEQQAEQARLKAEWDALSPAEQARITEETSKKVAEGMAQMLHETAARPGFVRRLLAKTKNDPSLLVLQKTTLKRRRV